MTRLHCNVNCRHHRGAAIKLTHAWQRGMHQAAAAFAAGDKAAASRIAQAARRKRCMLLLLIWPPVTKRIWQIAVTLRAAGTAGDACTV